MDREALKQRSVGAFEQVVTPVDRTAQRLLAAGEIARPTGEQCQVLIQARSDCCQWQCPCPRRAQFDRERQTVQPAAYLDDDWSRLVGQRERGLDRSGTIDEQLNGLVPDRLIGRELAGVGRWQA